MGIAGTMAFAPLGASSASLANANESEMTTEKGLITPKADDPVIYTTESGLEIKWGNAAPSINNSLPSGTSNLTEFPYFTTSKSGTTHTWVIIGRGLNTDVFTDNIQSLLFSRWKADNSAQYSNGAYGSSFFNGTFESSTPAGVSINEVLSSRGYVSDKVKVSKTVVQNKEIISGCVLALLNWPFEEAVYYSGNSYLNARDTCFDGSKNTLKLKHVSYYSNDTFGFGSYLSSIQSTEVKQVNQWWNGSAWNTDINNTTNLHFFPLASGTYTYENFVYSNYLTNQQYLTNVDRHTYFRSTWVASPYAYHTPIMWADGNGGSIWHDTQNGHWCASSNGTGVWWGTRPACVVKIV